MRILVLCLAFLLAACGGGGSDSNDSSSVNICQRSDVNSHLYCAMQQDYLWYRDIPDGINP
ncbi:MAG: carboxyl-terminal protease, partial [Gammaproteobacteria bacterium]|nr:carboxyl-terminal protease [Gammaproteobacteria bacterium]MBU1554987.1 carboxyl-terminal protease [Gammaproteobacteria bacterium]